MQLTFSSSNWWVLFISPWESEKWSKVCKLSLLCPLLSSNYLSIFTVLPIQLPCSNPMAVPRSVLGSLIGPRPEMLRNLLLCDNIIASIRAYWHCHFVLSRTALLFFWDYPLCSECPPEVSWSWTPPASYSCCGAGWLAGNSSSLEEGDTANQPAVAMGRATWVIPCHLWHGSADSQLK